MGNLWSNSRRKTSQSRPLSHEVKPLNKVVRPRVPAPAVPVAPGQPQLSAAKPKESVSSHPIVNTKPIAVRRTEPPAVTPKDTALPVKESHVCNYCNPVRRTQREPIEPPILKQTEPQVVRPKLGIPSTVLVNNERTLSKRLYAEPPAVNSQPHAARITEPPPAVRPRTRALPSYEGYLHHDGKQILAEPLASKRAEPQVVRPRESAPSHVFVKNGYTAVTRSPTEPPPARPVSSDNLLAERLRYARLQDARQKEVTPSENGDQDLARRKSVEPHRVIWSADLVAEKLRYDRLREARQWEVTPQNHGDQDVAGRMRTQVRQKLLMHGLDIEEIPNRCVNVPNRFQFEQPADQVKYGMYHDLVEWTESEEDTDEDSDSEGESSGPAEDTEKSSWDAVWVVHKRKFVPDVEGQMAMNVEAGIGSDRDSESKGTEIASSQRKLIQANNRVGGNYVGSSSTAGKLLGAGSRKIACHSDLAFPAQVSQLLTLTRENGHYDPKTTETCDEVPKNTENVKATSDGIEENSDRKVSLNFLDGIRPSDIKAYTEYITAGTVKYRLLTHHPQQNTGLLCDVTLDFNNRKQAVQFVEQARLYGGTMRVNVQLMCDANRESLHEFLELQCRASERKIQQSLCQHQLKIGEGMGRQTQQNKFLSAAEFDTVFINREALREKLNELELQKSEFIQFTDQLKEKLTALSRKSTVKNDAASIRRQVGLEMKRLSVALPIYARRSDIVDIVRNNQVCVVLGETGSGKSTQLPQYMYDAGYGDKGVIACTQPRKVAATSLAKHVAQELGTPPGKVVGYQLGTSRQASGTPKISYMTDHTLLSECIKDPHLKKYSCVIIDEAHERTVYTDLLIGMIKRCLVSRPDLRVVITSATIDPDVFIRYFDDCPLVRVSGRMFPVDVTYMPGNGPDGDFVGEAVRLTLDVHRNEPAGDILVFLTSPVDIEKACGMMVNARNQGPAANILPLHGRLQPAEQQLVFEPTKRGQRKIVFATNCAETSLTIPGIKYVIDTGLAKEKIYDGARNMSSLVVKYISQSSANQRKGRAGRTESGKCYRLYTKEQFTQMDTVSTPEIFRVHLGQALTKLMELGVKDPLSFEFVQAPPKEAFITAMTLLEKLGASKDGELTDLGKQMGKFSLEPRLAKFVLEAAAMGITFSGMVVAALCTLTGSIFFRAGNEEERTRADKLKVRFCDQQGDILTTLFAFKEWDSVKEHEKSKWCTKNSFNAKSMRIVRDALKEIKGVLTGELAVKVDHKFEDDIIIREVLPKLLLSCFCDSLAVFSGYDRAGYYLCEKDDEAPLNSVQIHPSSAFKFLGDNPQWVVYSQVLTTSQSFILNITSVQEDWIEELVSKGIIDIDMALVKSRLLQVELTGRVGRTTGRRLVGAKFTKLNELQDQIREAASTSSAFLAMNLDIGRLQLIGCHTYDDLILDLLKARVDCEKMNLSVQLEEESIAQGSKVRLLLASGGTLKNVLMPHEYRTVVMENVPVEMDKEEVLELCSYAGPVADCFQFKECSRTQNAAPTRWGKVTFIDPASAKNATENPSMFPFVAKPDVDRMRATKHNFQAKIEWCRKLPRGYAFVGFADDEDAEMARSNMRSLEFHDHRLGTARAQVKPGKNHDEIFIGQLPKWTTRDMIQCAIEEHPLFRTFAVEISKVAIPRENETTMESDVNSLGRQLTAKVKQYYQPGDISVTVLKPKPHNFKFTSYVSFGDAALGLQAVERMKDDNVSIRNQFVTITPIIETSLIVRKDIHDVTDVALEAMIEELENEGNVTITQSQQRGGDTLVRVKVNSGDMADAAYALSRLQCVTKGVFIDVTMERALQQLIHPANRGWLRSLEKRTRTSIQTDRRKMQVTIYGEKLGTTTAEAEIGQFLKKCASQEDRQIFLKGEGMPAGLMKKLFVAHGIHLAELQTKTGAAHLAINVRQHKLSASGSKESLGRVQEEIDQLQEKLESEQDVNSDEDISLGDCPICLCPVAVKDCYILECCGHPYCTHCIASLVDNAMRSRDFPVQCAAEDCGQLLFICDLTEILKELDGTWTELQGSSLESYLMRNKGKYKCCITPNCQMVYRPSRDGTQFFCDICHVSICTTCDLQYHHGITCDMFKVIHGMKKEDLSLKIWLMADPLNRSFCPQCKAPILKDGGCPSVQCRNCKTEMCWICKKTFRTNDDTYRHVRTVHNRPE